MTYEKLIERSLSDEKLIERFLSEYSDYHDISPRRRVEQRKALCRLREHAGKPLTEIEPPDLARFLASLELHPNTVAKYKGLIMPFYRWAASARVIDRALVFDLREVRLPRNAVPGEPRPYSRPELKEWWADLDASLPLSDYYVKRWVAGRSRFVRVYTHAMNLQIRAMVALALYCGLRQSEIHRAAINDIHPDNEYVVVRHAARKGRSAQARTREVPLTVGASEVMRSWFDLRRLIDPPHECPWLCLWRQHAMNPLSPWMMTNLLNRQVQGHWEFHRFRHTAATEWVRAEMPIQQVQYLLGHANIERTMRYVRVAGVDLRKTAHRLGPRFDRAVGPRRDEDGREAAA